MSNAYKSMQKRMQAQGATQQQVYEAIIAEKDRYIAALQANIDSLRNSYWKARAIMGFGNDGDETPAALAFPSIAQLMIDDATSMRADYDAAIGIDQLTEQLKETK